MVSASYHHCFQSAAKAAGRKMTADELLVLFDKAQAKMDRLVNEGMSPKDAAERAGKDLGDQARARAARMRFEKAFNTAIFAREKSALTKGDEYNGLFRLLAGAQRVTRDAARGVYASILDRQSRVLSLLQSDLENGGLLNVLKRRDAAFERDLARELWRLNDTRNRVAPTGNRHAERAAEIIGRHQDQIRAMQNKSGAWIGKIDGFVTTQSHDAWRIAGDEKDPVRSFAEWRQTIEPGLSEETFDNLDPKTSREDFLRATWRALATGVHESPETADWLRGFQGAANLAKKASQERKLIFKGPDDWLRYNARYGSGNLDNGNVFDSIVAGMSRGARNAAIMERLGTNPGAMYQRLIDDAISESKKRDDFAMVQKLDGLKTSGLFETMMGQGRGPGSKRMIKIATEMRAFQQLTKLGGVAISSLSDLANVASVARYQGIPLHQAYWDAISSAVPGWANAGKKYKRETAYLLGIATQGIMGDVIHRFASDDAPVGLFSRLTNRFYKFNGLSYWTDSVSNGAGLMFSAHLASNAAKDFAPLHPKLRQSLTRYGIEAPEWDILRRGVQKMPDGNDHIFADSVRALPDADFANAARKGETPDAARERIVNSLSTYVTDQVREAMTEPDLGTLRWTKGVEGAVSRMHPALGQAMRMVMQFKTFPLTHARRAVGRELIRGGVDVPGAIHLLAASTLLGYVAMTAKGILQGRNPRDPRDPRTLLAALQQGGGAGIYGDFLFGDASRTGNSFLENLAGPTFSDLSQLFDTAVHLRDTLTDSPDAPKSASMAGAVLRLAGAEIPFGNLPFVNIAIKQLLLYRLQDTINPGYSRRFERAVEKNSGQTFFLSPQTNVPRALGLVQ